MGCYEPNKRKKESKTTNITNKTNITNITNITNKSLYRIKEYMLSISPLIKIDRHISSVSKSICKINIQKASETKNGTGFLLRFRIDQELFYCLISNEHVISKETIDNKNTINILYDNEFKSVNIELDQNKRYIKCFTDIDLDVTIVEIIEEDNIFRDYFLYPEPEERINNGLINMNIYIPQYAEGKELKNAKGIIKEINNNEFTHLASTLKGSSGSPIFLENSMKVIGIHKECSTSKPENYGDFIYPAINIAKEDIRKIRNNGKYIDGKYIWDDGKYYIGEFKNNIPNGKGIKYYSNGNILYDGYFINGKFEGKGKYIYDDGDYFTGEYKDGLRNGKGIVYFKNGKILFEGEFINDKKEGKGKYFNSNGTYFIGEYKNDLKNGEGKEYYSNGKIKYEGEFFNDIYEGNGKYITEDGHFYKGQFKNGLFHGKGKEYYPNGNIKYDGDWVNQCREGIGKFFLKNGEYYEGQFKNGIIDGKGIWYYSNGNIRYDGDLVSNQFEGNGKYIWENGEYYKGQFQNGLRNGKGIEYDSNGNIIYDGVWINDEPEENKN